MQVEVSNADSLGAPAGLVSLEGLSEKTFYCFNPDAVEAFSHTIEDLAMEEADGHLVSVFPRFRDFAGHREQYAHLGTTLDKVEVYGEGRVPGRLPRVRFRKIACPDYRLAAFMGKRVRVLFVSRVVRGHAGVANGFYTFDARLIKRIREDLEAMTGGRATRLPEFHRLQGIDSAAKQIESAFAREKEAMDVAFRRLQLDGGAYDAGRCAGDLEKGLTRLGQWRRRLPEMLGDIR